MKSIWILPALLMGAAISAETAQNIVPRPSPVPIHRKVVTSLDDSGPGSLREALNGSFRYVVFEVGGVIRLKSELKLTHHNVTIDGAAAPKPGITIVGKPFVIADVANIQIKHLRFRESSDDNLRISGACRNILIENCSSTHGGDGAIDITHDYKTGKRPTGIIIRNCLIGATEKAMLVVGVDNLYIDHNLFTNNGQRNPQLHDAKKFNVVNNLVRNWTVYGIRVRAGSTGNLIGNHVPLSPFLPKRPDRSMQVLKGDDSPAGVVYCAGNLGPEGFDADRQGNCAQPVSPDLMATHEARELEKVLASKVGARPLDPVDQQLVENSLSIRPRPSMTKDK